ncbi:hypothetical protein P5G50_09895 [Leifsonia sp. F6_8S_P_1B]|uniref:Uncharacterized protein n=1 Tax=Leifsonia williamsii TaxID=3035919 RepID=A0ABT8KBD0_9MICO|nr:hypothetical protein [Leifsonia williamsii]MDN4614766.1 hypothetical protein [Leifsonia williamsii]
MTADALPANIEAGGGVYDGSLEPVAAMDDYVDQFAEAGVDIPAAQAEATNTTDGLAPTHVTRSS